MISLVRIISSTTDKFNSIVAKFYRMGKTDVQTAKVYGPAGIDCNPIAEMSAIYMQTGTKGKTVLVGFLNTNSIAEPGELRLFSTDQNGIEKTFIWLKGNGELHFGGDSDNAVRYTPLNTGLQDFVSAIQQELVEIAAGISTAGGSYTPAVLSIDISDSKIDKIKTS